MSTEGRRIAAWVVIAVCAVILVDVPMVALYAPGYIRWDHVAVTASAAAAFAAAALAWLYGTRNTPRPLSGEEINTAYYLKWAAWEPPLVFAGGRP